MIKTEVVNIPANYERHGIIEIVDNYVRFDTSGGEYGPCVFPLNLLMEKVIEHCTKQKIEKHGKGD